MAEGTVKWFSNRKGYGFIEQNEAEDSEKEQKDDLFVHHTSIQMDGYRTLSEGEKVIFDIEDSDRGPVAKNVKKA